VPIAADYPFLEVMWSTIVFFAWVAWIIVLIRIVGDVFRRDDSSGLKKATWMVFLIFVPFLGVLVYLITNGNDMTRRDVEQAKARRAEFDGYVKSVAANGDGGSAEEIETAMRLRDKGAITEAEFLALKQKALA
jgi:Phospholipase_D-nuclease N-terminal